MATLPLANVAARTSRRNRLFHVGIMMLVASNVVPEEGQSRGPLDSLVTSALQVSLRRIGTKMPFIEPGSPWENGYIGSFNGKLRDEWLNGEIFDAVREVRVMTERWRKHYLPASRQHGQTTQLTWIQAVGTRNVCLSPGGQCLKKDQNELIIGINTGVWARSGFVLKDMTTPQLSLVPEGPLLE